MYQTSQLCEPLRTEKNETFPYYEYYLGEKDDHNRRHGNGQNCWTGVESMEWHTGHFVRDTMHGPGEYRWRYRGKNGLFVTYEGNLYVNTFHGYGAVSYPDGRVFTGLFNNDLRYGPGIETFADLHANVGLWRGRLVRLAWRPAAPGVTPDLLAWPGGRPLVDPHRIVLNATCRSIGKVNEAVEFLKQHGSDPVAATENWSRLYPKHCTDTASRLCHVDLFEGQYYNGKIYSLKEQESVLENDEELGNESEDGFEPFGTYYTWNNDKVTMDMMKHCYKHERQREHTRVDLTSVLSGPRNLFKPAAIHELDCRTLLMACYLGHVASTTYLVNERNVDPNLADMLGNSAVMYATCGDQADLINFLVEAGANVDSVNDSCCTALGAALIRLACAKRDIPANGMMPALIPPPVVPASPPEPHTVYEWNINRDLQAPEAKNTLGRASKLNKMNVKEKSLISVKNPQLPNKKPPGTLDPIAEDGASVSLGYENNEDKLYKDINSEYISKVTDLFVTVGQPATYLFELKNMVEEINDEQLKMVQPEKTPKKKLSDKELRETTKPSKDTMWQNNQKDGDSQTSRDSVKSKLCDRIKLTILQLLNSGANPRLVKCPQPALFLAIVAGCPDLINHLVQFGADVNEVYSQLLYYTPLDIAVSQSMEHTTVDTVRALLSAGARADRRLRCVVHASSSLEPELELPGPTLLHAVMARRCDSDAEEDVRRQIIELLLEYNCDPLKRYNGRSALDDATNNLELLDIIINSPRTNLNGVINDAHQTILVKMFNMPYFKTLDNTERSHTLTKLLLFGADPLTECEHEGVKYKNLFVMAKNTLSDMTNHVKPVVESKTKMNIRMYL